MTTSRQRSTGAATYLSKFLGNRKQQLALDRLFSVAKNNRTAGQEPSYWIYAYVFNCHLLGCGGDLKKRRPGCSR